MFLENFRCDWDGGVNWIWNDADHGLGAVRAQATVRVARIVAWVLSRSSHVMPAFLGTPAVIATLLQPSGQSGSCPAPRCPFTIALVAMWLPSAATPGVWTIPWRVGRLTKGPLFRRSESGCRTPPSPQHGCFSIVLGRGAKDAAESSARRPGGGRWGVDQHGKEPARDKRRKKIWYFYFYLLLYCKRKVPVRKHVTEQTFSLVILTCFILPMQSNNTHMYLRMQR